MSRLKGGPYAFGKDSRGLIQVGNKVGGAAILAYVQAGDALVGERLEARE